MSDQPPDPHQPPWTRPSGGGSGGRPPGGTGPGSAGPGGAGAPAPGTPDWLRKPGDDTLADAHRPDLGRPGQHPGPGPGWQGAGGGNNGGRGPLIAVGAVIAVLLVAVVVILGVLVTREGETVVVRRPAPPVPTTPSTATTTTTPGVTRSGEATAPGGGATARSVDGSITLPVPGGWDYESTSYGAASTSIRLTPPITSGDFEGSYLGVTLTARRSYAYSSSPEETVNRRRESDRSAGYTVSALPDATLAGAPAKGTRTIMRLSSSRNERRVYVAQRDGKDYELRTYGSPAANRRWERQVTSIMAGVRAG